MSAWSDCVHSHKHTLLLVHLWLALELPLLESTFHTFLCTPMSTMFVVYFSAAFSLQISCSFAQTGVQESSSKVVLFECSSAYAASLQCIYLTAAFFLWLWTTFQSLAIEKLCKIWKINEDVCFL